MLDETFFSRIKNSSAIEHKVARLMELKPVAQNQWSMWLRPEIEFESFSAGQFCMLSALDLVDPLLPKPFPIVDEKDGALRFLFRVVDRFTQMLASQILGSRLGILGPLGRGIDHELSFGKKIVVVAEGIGYATVLPMLTLMKKRGIVDPILFYGLRSDLEAIRQGPYAARYVSQDGSIGVKGTVCDILRNQFDELKNFDLFIVSVSSTMTREISQILPRDKSYYFLERPMACGFGVCGSCKISLISESGSGRHGVSCVEGPFFRGDQIEVCLKEIS